MNEKTKNVQNIKSLQEKNIQSISISILPSQQKFNLLILQLQKLAENSISNPQNSKMFLQLLEKLQIEHQKQLFVHLNSKKQKNNSLLKESQLDELALLSKHSRSGHQNQLTHIIVQNEIKQLKLQNKEDVIKHFKRQKSPHKLLIHKVQEENQKQLIVVNECKRQSLSKGKYQKFQPGLLAKNHKINKK